ncbi:hypothetical protein [Lentzea atacamensis]|uniref:hypothetical protein n=1 Tax=Lentzea atacamensis TaxID=531938 RepID=UPI000D6C12A9|nr:hypothetical protein [Lentzea atacamensis]
MGLAHPGAIETGFFAGTTTKINPPPPTFPPPSREGRSTTTRGCPVLSGPGFNRAMTWVARLLPRTAVARAAGVLNRRPRLHEVVDLV